MNIKEFISKLDQRFASKIEAKTGWGKNEVIEAFRHAVTETLIDSIDDLLEGKK
jgi:hypothetical protein